MFFDVYDNCPISADVFEYPSLFTIVEVGQDMLKGKHLLSAVYM